MPWFCMCCEIFMKDIVKYRKTVLCAQNANFTVRTVVFYFPCDFFFFQEKSHDSNTYFNIEYAYIYIHFSFSCISKSFYSV